MIMNTLNSVSSDTYILQIIIQQKLERLVESNGKQMIKVPEKWEYIRFKNYERKIKSPFMIYADFESILIPEDNEKQNPEESYANKNQKHVALSYGNKLVCVNDQLSKPFKSYLGGNAVYNFINIMIEESKFCTNIMQKHLNKELVMAKK